MCTADFRTAIQRYLEARGHRTRCAVDGIDALEQVAQRVPDLVICDLRMPRLGGLGVLRAIRGARDDVSVVMVTGHPTAHTADQARQQGADDYLEKPFELQELNRSIARARSRVNGDFMKQ